MSGSFANAGEAVDRNLDARGGAVNRRGGVRLPGGARTLELLRFDSKGNSEEAIAGCCARDRPAGERRDAGQQLRRRGGAGRAP
jgi:hypothetical protein